VLHGVVQRGASDLFVQLGQLASDDDVAQRTAGDLEVGERALQAMRRLVDDDGASFVGDLGDA